MVWRVSTVAKNVLPCDLVISQGIAWREISACVHSIEIITKKLEIIQIHLKCTMDK